MRDLSLKKHLPRLVGACYLRWIAGASILLIVVHGLPVRLQQTAVYSWRLKCGLPTITTTDTITVSHALDWRLTTYRLAKFVSSLWRVLIKKILLLTHRSTCILHVTLSGLWGLHNSTHINPGCGRLRASLLALNFWTSCHQRTASILLGRVCLRTADCSTYSLIKHLQRSLTVLIYLLLRGARIHKLEL